MSVPQAVRTSFWQPAQPEDEDRAVLNCFKKRMNVIEECELFDESDDDYEIDVDKLIESEQNLSEKFRKRNEDPNFYKDYLGEGSTHTVKPSAVSNTSKGVIPIEKSTGAIFGSHKRIDEVTYRNYINAKRPSTLVVSKIQGLQPRIDTTGVPLRENERYKKFEDYVIDKKKQAEEDHRMKDFRKSPYSVTNMIKVRCKKKLKDGETSSKKSKIKNTHKPKPQKEVPSSLSKPKKTVKKVVEHHHHFYKDGQIVHSEVSSSSQPPPIVMEEPQKPLLPAKYDYITTNPTQQTSQSYTVKPLDQSVSETSSQKSNTLSTHSKVSIEPLPNPPETKEERPYLRNDQSEKENMLLGNNTSKEAIFTKATVGSKTQKNNNPEKNLRVPFDSRAQIQKENPNENPPDRYSEKLNFNLASNHKSQNESHGQPPINLFKKKEMTSEEGHKMKELSNSIECILSNRKDDMSIDLKLKRFLKKRERKKQKNKRSSSTSPLRQSSSSLQSSTKTSTSSLVSSRSLHHVREVLSHLDFSKVKALPMEKKLTIEDVHPYHVASLSTPNEIGSFVEMAESSVNKILKQLEQVPENLDNSKSKQVCEKLLQSQLESIKKLADEVKEAYHLATEKVDSSTKFVHDAELDGFARSTKLHDTTVKADIKGHAYPHSIDEYNKRKSAGVEGNYKSVIEKKQEMLPSSSQNSSSKSKRPSSAPPKGQQVKQAVTASNTGARQRNATSGQTLSQQPSQPKKLVDETITPTSKQPKFKKPLRIEIENNDESTHVVEEEVVNSPPTSPEHDHPSAKSTYFNLNSSVEENNVEVNPYF
ncbi:hypothetical protein FDP41_000666 [Naegleria fowleri]|uniref:Uncharacterized protein n=1 Tax=Naegleria fowleri TaxID=5763 RepID=A0A6A5C641_NAEFO|nr:uncharacterized protein FDP41_000666 [Naegleria fowleri]KAF0984767.1 hypothetical protein FDP41_000666 [Naegleria fowleri]